MSGNWRDRRVPEFQAYLRGVLGREPTERDYAAAVMQLEQRGAGSVAVGHAFRNRLQAEGGDPARHLRHYDPIALGHRWREVTPQAVEKWGTEYDRISSGAGPLQSGQTHFFSPAGMQSYYDKGPSLVRSAVRMNVPGHGEVLVPNWATKAVAAGDFTNVNGEWFLAPNERYGKAVAERSQDAEAQPGGFYGNAPAPQPAPTAVAAAPARQPEAAPAAEAKPAWSKALGDAGGFAEAAMRIARAPQQQQDRGIEPMQFVTPAPIRPTRMAAAPVPYLARAEGGAIDDTGHNVPESTDSIRAQQRQLIEGRRAAQMFPRGTPELPLPPFMERVETPRGVYHFDPQRISAQEVVEASMAARENEILGLGPLSKDDVSRLVAETGEPPVAITERDAAGNEVKASMATPSTVEMQSDAILRGAAPGHSVDVEPVGDVVMSRDHGDRALALARAEGGSVGNDFKELTPEQKAMIDRDKIDESLGPFDFMPGPITALGAGIGGVFGARMLADIPRDFRIARSYGESVGGALRDAVPWNLGAAGALVAGPAAAGYAMELKDRFFDRSDRERQMMFGNPSDAEGQDGGFYGDRKRADGGGIRPYSSDVDSTSWHPDTVTRESVREYDPSIRDRASDFIRDRFFGSSYAPEVSNLVTGMTGSSGMSRDGISAAEMLSTPALVAGTAMDVGQHLANDNPSMGTLRGLMSVPMLLAQRYGGHLLGTPSKSDVRATSDMVRREATPRPSEAELTAAREKLYGPNPATRRPVDREAQYEADIAALEARRLSALARDEAALTKEKGAVGDIAKRYESGDLRILNEPAYVKDARAAGAPEQAPPPEWYRGVREFWEMPKPERLHADGGRVDEYARGGGISTGSSAVVGPLSGATGGRADKIPATALPGSHVLPADIVSHMGQGNTNAGLKMLSQMFKTGPYGMPLAPRARRRGFAEGGEVAEEIPVMLSDGEFVIPPETVAEIGGGDIAMGHDVLDAWIMDERQRAIKTLAELPPPATD